MKKNLFLVLGLVFVLSLTGCYSHYEDVKFVDIKFYDTEDNEIIGEYINYFHGVFDDTELRLSTGDNILLNSPAPIINFYCVTVEEGVTIKVVMKLKVKDAEVKSLTFMREDDRANMVSEMDKIEVINDFTFVTLTVENIAEDNNLFQVLTWSDGTSEEFFSTSGGNTYIRGFYFRIAKSNNDETNL